MKQILFTIYDDGQWSAVELAAENQVQAVPSDFKKKYHDEVDILLTRLEARLQERQAFVEANRWVGTSEDGFIGSVAKRLRELNGALLMPDADLPLFSSKIQALASSLHSAAGQLSKNVHIPGWSEVISLSSRLLNHVTEHSREKVSQQWVLTKERAADPSVRTHPDQNVLKSILGGV